VRGSSWTCEGCPVDYRTLPATGDDLSVLGFGAMGMAGWFGDIDDNDAIRAPHSISASTSSTPPSAY
jgi:hypothetical protein